jgi:Zn-dependent protease
MSVVIHEVSHGYAALALGDPTAKYQGRLTLNPISHFDFIGSLVVPLVGYLAGGFIVSWAKPVPFNPYNLRNQRWGEAIVAAAGALSNLLLAVVFGIIIRLLVSYGIASASFLSLASFVVYINITLAIFNLAPIPPLDGSKILFAVLSYKWQRFRASVERYGLVFVFLFIFLIWPIISPLIGFLFTVLTGLIA